MRVLVVKCAGGNHLDLISRCQISTIHLSLDSNRDSSLFLKTSSSHGSLSLLFLEQLHGLVLFDTSEVVFVCYSRSWIYPWLGFSFKLANFIEIGCREGSVLKLLHKGENQNKSTILAWSDFKLDNCK